MNKDTLTNAKYEVEENSAMSAIKANLLPQRLYISCDEVTISVNSLKLKLDFTTEQLKQFDTLEIDGIVFQKTEQKL